MTTNETDTTLPEELGARISIVIEIREGATIDINGMAMGFSEAARWLRAVAREGRAPVEPRAGDDLTAEQRDAILAALSVGLHRADQQSNDWVGHAIIAKHPMTKQRAVDLVKQWMASGVLETYRQRDRASYKMRSYVRPA